MRRSMKCLLNVWDPRIRLSRVPLKRNTEPDHGPYLPFCPAYPEYQPIRKTVVRGGGGRTPAFKCLAVVLYRTDASHWSLDSLERREG